MTDEIKLRKAQGRAARVETLMRDEMLQEAFATLEAEYIRGWKLTADTEHAARERLYIAVQLVSEIKRHLRKVLDDGKLATRDLNQLQAERQKRPAA